MNFIITRKAKLKLLEMQEKNIPIKIISKPIGWSGFIYEIAPEGQFKNDKIYNVEGINIIVSSDLEGTFTGAKINYGGLFIKSFFVTPKFS